MTFVYAYDLYIYIYTYDICHIICIMSILDNIHIQNLGKHINFSCPPAPWRAANPVMAAKVVP